MTMFFQKKLSMNVIKFERANYPFGLELFV